VRRERRIRLAVGRRGEWLERHGVKGEVRAPTTLAFLYARADGLDPPEGHVATGFAG